LDSVAALSLLAAINDHFGSALTPTDLVAAGTVTRITERLGHGRRASSPVVVPVRIAPEAHIRVALVPGAGGDALMMAPWAASGILGQHDVVAITPPGHGSDTQEPLADLDRSAELYADSLPSDDRPLIVVGFSLGCLVAFEVARRLELDGRPAIALVLVHGAAPDAWTDFPLRSDGPSFVDAFTAVYESYADMPQSKDAFLAAARADFAAAEGYDPSGRRVDCPVHVIASSDDSLVTTPPTAWRSFASHLHVHESVGEHFEFLTHEANRELLRRVCASSIAGQAPVTTPD
jgi:surfactin synthase thioesterase subunit